MISISLCMIVRDEEKVLGRLRENIQIKSMISGGRMISPRPEILLLPEHPEHIVCGWTQTM